MANRFSIEVTEESMRLDELILTHQGDEKPFIPKAYAVRAIRHIQAHIWSDVPHPKSDELCYICDVCIKKLLQLGGERNDD